MYRIHTACKICVSMPSLLKLHRTNHMSNHSVLPEMLQVSDAQGLRFAAQIIGPIIG